MSAPRLMAGDVVIWEKPGSSVCAFCRILQDDRWPHAWEWGASADAEQKAQTTLAETGGTLHLFIQPTDPSTSIAECE